MEATMYRLILTALLYLGGASPAPQDSSSITYVRPLSEDPPAPPGPPARESRVENLPLVIGGAVNQTKPEEETERILFSESQLDFSTPPVPYHTVEESTVSEGEAPSTERSPDVTEASERPLPVPRFTSKLSYFHKSSADATNLVERTGKRKFRSRCRCEKIWNCPKLQITVPRCPEEYFMCCF